jgi:16S rRNA C1402 (ribose-2'-O) methylase RsmI
MGEKQQVFIGVELTKKFETHYRGPVGEVLKDLEDKVEGSKMKGEVTLVIAPCEDQE